MRRWLLRILIALLVLAVAGVAIGEGYRLYRQSVVRSYTRIDPAVGLESLERVALGGLEQWILIRSQNPKNPPLLWLQGGPGLPTFPWVRLMGMESGLEHDLTMVYWEQRGTGKSAGAAFTPGALTIDNYVSDVCQLGAMLRARFDNQRVLLAAHSWGTVIGIKAIQKCPELFSAYVGISSLVNTVEQDRNSTDFIREQARQSSDRDALQILNTIGNPPFTIDNKIKQRGLLNRFRGVDARRPQTFWKTFKDTVQTPEYRLTELAAMMVDPYRAQRQVEGEMNRLDLLSSPISLKVPVYLVHGRKDMLVSQTLAEKLYRHIEAAAGKELILLEESAHMVPLEQPEELRKIIRRVKAGQILLAPDPAPAKPAVKKKARTKAQP